MSKKDITYYHDQGFLGIEWTLYMVLPAVKSVFEGDINYEYKKRNIALTFTNCIFGF